MNKIGNFLCSDGRFLQALSHVKNNLSSLLTLYISLLHVFIAGKVTRVYNIWQSGNGQEGILEKREQDKWTSFMKVKYLWNVNNHQIHVVVQPKVVITMYRNLWDSKLL